MQTSLLTRSFTMPQTATKNSGASSIYDIHHNDTILMELSVKALSLVQQLTDELCQNSNSGSTELEAIEDIRAFTTRVSVAILQTAVFKGHRSIGGRINKNATPSVEYFETELRRSRLKRANNVDAGVSTAAPLVTPERIAKHLSEAAAPSSPPSDLDLKMPGFDSYEKSKSRSSATDNEWKKRGTNLSFLPVSNSLNSDGEGSHIYSSERTNSFPTQIIPTPICMKSRKELEPLRTPPISPPTLPSHTRVTPDSSNSVEMVWDQIADLMLRLCFQLENSIERNKPNYYGVFDSRIIWREILSILKPRLNHCVDAVLEQPVPIGSGHRNAPLFDEDIDILSSPSTNSIRPWPKLVTEITGRVFWEDYCSNSLSVSWLHFSSVFQELYGKQPARAMDVFMKTICTPETIRNSGFSSRKVSKPHKNCPPTPGGFPGVDEKESLALSSNYITSKNTFSSSSIRVKPNPAKSIVHADVFAKFCLDHGGLYEGFITITDPATQVMCLGRFDDDQHVNPLIPLPKSIGGLLGVKIFQVSCGGEHAAVLTEGGVVATWGKGDFGRLGHGTIDSSTRPRQVFGLKDHNVIKVACGFAYTTAITSKGSLYSWGAGENGRLGLGDHRDRFTPQKVLLPYSTKVLDCQAGSVHTCLLTEKGRIFSCGKYEYTGHGDKRDVLTPKKLECFCEGKNSIRISQISVGPGGYHTIALAANGTVYTWGHNRVGQLGFCNSKYIPKTTTGAYFIPTPKVVTSLEGLDIVQVVAGWGHSAVLTSEGALYTCGRNFQGQLGLGDPSTFALNERGHPHQPEFKHVEALSHVQISQVSCGGEHSVVLTKSGQVYTFGKGDHGQLGHGRDGSSHNYPKLIEAFKQDGRSTLQVACGNNCTLVLRGHFKVPSLFSLCRDKIINTMDHSVLPPVVTSIFEHFPENP